MPLYTGTIISATPQAAMIDIIKTKCGTAGLANWTFIENLPAGTGAGTSGSASYSSDIFKCAGSGDDANDAGQDWYLIFARDYLYDLRINACEVYNAVSKEVAKYFFYKANLSKSGAAVDANGYPYYSSTYSATEIKTVYPLGPYGDYFSCTPMPTTGFSYWLYMTNNNFLLSIRMGTTEWTGLIGLMDSLVDDSIGDPLPLFQLTNTGTSNSFTRLPGVASKATIPYVFGADIVGWNNNVTNDTTYGVGYSHSGLIDKWLAHTPLSRGLVYHEINNNNSHSVYGVCRGLLKDDIRVVMLDASSNNIGDTFTTDEATPEVWTMAGRKHPFGFLVRGDV